MTQLRSALRTMCFLTSTECGKLPSAIDLFPFWDCRKDGEYCYLISDIATHPFGVTPKPMSNIARIDSRACSGCGLCVTFAREPGSIALRYDMAAWERQCRRKECDGPTSCPFLGLDLQLRLREDVEQENTTAPAL